MRKVVIFSTLLLLGLVGSQLFPLFGQAYASFGDAIRVLTMIGLSFIMVRVGYEFDMDKSRMRDYGWDYLVAFTAASLPWIFVSLYFVFVLLPADLWSQLDAWKETLLASRFAAPTSAGVLFSMLTAAGFGATWLFRKARVLAIFDDLDTVLLMIPLKMLMVGIAWQLGIIVVVMASMLIVAFIFLHRIRIPYTWPWVLMYATLITVGSEIVYKLSKIIDDSVPIHIEVLLPAFVLGCTMAYPRKKTTDTDETDAHHDNGIETPMEKRVSTIVSGAFMVLVGLSMPLILSTQPDTDHPAMSAEVESSLHAAGAPDAEQSAVDTGQKNHIGRVTAAQPQLDWPTIMLHVLLITIIANFGKMFPLLTYRKEAHWRERLALTIGMWPRGEVGAGVLVISLSYGIGGPIVTIAMLSLALNLLLTGFFIVLVRILTKQLPGYETH
ncbi:MAG: sodium:proton antiporter [Deltaproteobacteria bacterium]|nr:sodium:proton antiporter [Deltaproteobacteria bacterium]MBN2674190.1 sodium:proton antiporter [Deltaproteobacteria bacterium]